MKKFWKTSLIVLGVIAVLYAALALVNVINLNIMDGYIDTFGAVEYEQQLVPERDQLGNYSFETDGDFKVMHLTDIHIGGGFLSARTDKQVLNAVAAMINAEKPDLVIVTGDISFAVPYAAGTVNNKYAHNMFISLMENLGVYWTVTFGNHDSEAYNYYNREAVASMYTDESLRHCLFSSAEGVSGEGNHVISVRGSDGNVTQCFYMLDSHSYTDKDPLGVLWDYDNIKEDQIEWYKENVAAYNLLGKSESAVKSLMFFHIPIREVQYAYQEYVNNSRQNTENVILIEGINGETDEGVYCPKTDEDLFETVLELGSTQALFYGHDHLNNTVIEYKGVILSYGYSMDYLAYFGIAGQGDQRGATVITCSPDSSVKIVHENYYQDKYVPLYEKEEVKIGK